VGIASREGKSRGELRERGRRREMMFIKCYQSKKLLEKARSSGRRR
jgi:hypothetical protein